MQNLIDMSNHILKHPAYYAGKQEATEEIIAEAIDLTFKYGDFAIQFVEKYIELELSEEFK